MEKERTVKTNILQPTKCWTNVYCEFESILAKELVKQGYEITHCEDYRRVHIEGLGSGRISNDLLSYEYDISIDKEDLYNEKGHDIDYDKRNIEIERKLLYSYIKVKGGWLIKEGKSITFIPDPEHKNEPLPVE